MGSQAVGVRPRAGPRGKEQGTVASVHGEQNHMHLEQPKPDTTHEGLSSSSRVRKQ